MPFDVTSAGTGVEWTINKRDGILDAWQEVSIDSGNDTPLSDFHITLTGYTATMAQESLVVTTIPIVSINSLTISCTNVSGDLFIPPDTNRLFASTSSPVRVGIVTTSYYDWGSVFDQSSVKYIPGLAVSTPFVRGADVEVGPVGSLPNEPIDLLADPPVYPMDTVTSFRPDTRDSVTLNFSATVDCVVGGSPYPETDVTETVNWTQTVNQNPYDWGSVLRDAIYNRTYFANGYTSNKR